MLFAEPCPRWAAAVSDISRDFTAQLEIPVKTLILKQQQNMNESNNGLVMNFQPRSWQRNKAYGWQLKLDKHSLLIRYTFLTVRGSN